MQVWQVLIFKSGAWVKSFLIHFFSFTNLIKKFPPPLKENFFDISFISLSRASFIWPYLWLKKNFSQLF